MNGLRNSSLMLASLLSLAFIAGAHAASEYAVEIDLQDQRAYLLHNGRMVMESPISSGRANYRTATGSFEIIEKDMDHHSSLYGMIVDAQGGTLVADADADMPVPPGGSVCSAPTCAAVRAVLPLVVVIQVSGSSRWKQDGADFVTPERQMSR